MAPTPETDYNIQLSIECSSTVKLHERQLGTAIKRRVGHTILYPSITACMVPKENFYFNSDWAGPQPLPYPLRAMLLDIKYTRMAANGRHD